MAPPFICTCWLHSIYLCTPVTFKLLRRSVTWALRKPSGGGTIRAGSALRRTANTATYPRLGGGTREKAHRSWYRSCRCRGGRDGAVRHGCRGSGADVRRPDLRGRVVGDRAKPVNGRRGRQGGRQAAAGRMHRHRSHGTRRSSAPSTAVHVDSQGEFILALNCNGEYATATNPGASLASPEGREAKAAADEAAAAEEATARRGGRARAIARQ